jgi:DnaJ-class molecular chaperone
MKQAQAKRDEPKMSRHSAPEPAIDVCPSCNDDQSIVAATTFDPMAQPEPCPTCRGTGHVVPSGFACSRALP